MKPGNESPSIERRPSVEVYFECCNTRALAYFNAQGTAYTGHCPKCASPVRIPVGPGGSRSKTWVAG